MKTAISIPENVFRSAEHLAQRLGVSRSALYSKAVADLVARYQDDAVTLRLNEVYGPGGEASSLDADASAIQYRSLARRQRQ